MFWRKALHILVISILLVGGITSPSTAGEGKILAKTSLAKPLATVITYVDVDAPGPTYDGTSWSNAYTTVQDALTTVINGTQIWVAEGIYYPDEGTGQTNDVISSTFVLTDGVALYGGFMGTEGFLDERDWDTHITVLSGDIDHETNPDMTDSSGVVTDTANINGRNAYHVTSSSGVTETAILDGFTITAGQAYNVGPVSPCGPVCGGGMYNISDSNPKLTNITFSGNLAERFGGGMYNYSDSNPALTNVSFISNSAKYHGGGGVYNYQSSPTLTNVVFSDNAADEYGGGIMNDNSSPTLTDVTFSGNESNLGGGMMNDNSNPVLTNVTFSDNLARAWGGGVHNSSSSPTLTDVTFYGNSAINYSGGGMSNISDSNPLLNNVIFSNNSDGGMSNSYSSPVLTNVTFSNNSDGGMSNSYSSPVLTNVTFSGNSAPSCGGMSNYESNPTLSDVTFTNNSANNGSDGHGGGMCGFYSSPTLNNVTFSGNSATGDGGGISTYYNGSPMLNNVTFSGNEARSGGGMLNSSSSPILTDVIFSGNLASDDGGGLWDSGGGTLTNVAFFNNSAGNNGGGMINYGDQILTNAIFSGNEASYGGGMYNSSSSPGLTNVTFSSNSANNGGGMFNYLKSNPVLTNVTFSGNSANNGGGMYNYGDFYYGNTSNPNLSNTILWGNTADYDGDQIWNNDASTPVISYTLIQESGGSGAGWDVSLGTDGGGNIDEDPLLVDPLNDDLHLSYGSLAIDSGDNSNCPLTDLDGVSRPQGLGCDMGAFEFVPVVLLAMTVDNSTPVPGEIITFTIQVTNYLTETMTGGVISDTLSADLNFLELISLDPPFSGTVGSEPPILVTDLEIAAEEQVTVTLPVGVSEELAGGTVITNTVSVTSTEVVTPVLRSVTITIPAAGPWYVAPDGDDRDDCLSPSTPCATINGTLNKPGFIAGSTVLAAIGVYTDTGSEVVLIDKVVTLSGGWDNSFNEQTGSSTLDGEDERRGLYVNDNVTTSISNFTIQNCYTDDGNGGGIYNNGVLTITNSTIKDCFAYFGDYFGHGGGGIYNIGTLSLINSIVSNNIATDGGGGIFATNSSSTTIMDSKVYSNTSNNWEGGGIQIFQNSDLSVYRSWVVGNAAVSNDGGGIGVNDGGAIYIENSIIAGNYTDGAGGGLWLSGGEIINSSIVGNQANYSGAAIAGYSQIGITNTMIISNVGSTGISGEGTISLSYCDTYGNSPDGTTGVIITRTNCLGTPPEDGLNSLMVGGPLPGGVGPAFADQWLNYDYHLQANSPAIDTGDDSVCPATDLDGVLRPQGSGCDMGAYEFIPNTPPVAVDDDGTGFTTDEDTNFTTASVLTNDSDPKGDSMTVESFDTTGTKGLVTDNGDGTFDYDPNGQFEDLDAGEKATDTFGYTISDGNGGTDSAIVTITITGIDDAFELYLPLVVGK